MSGPTPLTRDELRRIPVPLPGKNADKDERGRALVIAGSLEVPGGALLAGVAALRAGAGKLQIATSASIAPFIGLSIPEALVIGLPEPGAGGSVAEIIKLLLPRARASDAVLIGPGMMDRDSVTAITDHLLEACEAPAFVLDAGALQGLKPGEALHRQAGRVVLTPHPGEMAALLSIPREQIVADPLTAARAAAASLQCVIAMKGANTFIVTPQGAAWCFENGNIGLATSGSGDALAGIIAGLLARGATPVQATLWGVFLHGEAGNRLAQTVGEIGFLARELLPLIPSLLTDIASGSGEQR